MNRKERVRPRSEVQRCRLRLQTLASQETETISASCFRARRTEVFERMQVSICCQFHTKPCALNPSIKPQPPKPKPCHNSRVYNHRNEAFCKDFYMLTWPGSQSRCTRGRIPKHLKHLNQGSPVEPGSKLSVKPQNLAEKPAMVSRGASAPGARISQRPAFFLPKEKR